MAQTVFIGGPIQYALEDDGFNGDLKGLIEAVLSRVEFAGYEVISAHRYEQYGEMDVDGQHFLVSQRDFAWMQSCDVFVAILPNSAPGLPMRTDGTCVELGWASSLKRPIVVVRSLETEHSHLIKGLGSLTCVEEVDLAAAEQDSGAVVSAIASVYQASQNPRRKSDA